MKIIWQQKSLRLSLPSLSKNWRVGQGVKTPPFHGGITGSNPVRGTNKYYKALNCNGFEAFFFSGVGKGDTSTH